MLTHTPPKTYATHRAVHLMDEAVGEVRGYIFIWGSDAERDSYGTYFDRERPPELSFSGDLAGRDICYEHGQNEIVGKRAIGQITRTWYDDTGLAFEGRLDRSHPLFARFIGELRAGDLFTSSSTGEHVAEFTDDGAFRNWLLTELSFTAQPAESRMPAVQLVRSHERAAFSPDPERTHGEHIPMDMPLDTAAPPTPQARTIEDMLGELMQQYSYDEIMMALEAMKQPDEEVALSDAADAPRSKAFLADLKAALDSRKQGSDIASLRAEIAALKTAQEAQRSAPPAQAAAPTVRGGHVSVSEPRKYWHNDDLDMIFAYRVMRSNRIQPSDDFMRVLGGRMGEAVEKDKPLVKDRMVRSLMPSTRANEVAISTAAGGGDEWVSIMWDTAIWEKARSNRIYQELVNKGMREVDVPQGSESTYITTEDADPTVYTIAQDADLAASGRPDVNVGATRIGTGRVLLTPGELGMAVVYSDVFQEDSIVNVASQYNRQMQEKAAETIEQLFINGDTQTSTTNINYDDGTPGTGLSTPYYIASNGAIKYALVTGSSTSRSGGALDENDFRLTLKLLPSAIRTRKSQLAFILDPDTHNTALAIDALKTEDVRRTNATIESGVLTNVYGVDVFESGFMELAASDGKITYNAAGTLGRLLCVYAPYWAVGTKRAITMESDRDILSGTNIIVAKMRVGFQYRGAGASVITYNITIS